MQDLSISENMNKQILDGTVPFKNFEITLMIG
jgi:hypothetical protein